VAINTNIFFECRAREAKNFQWRKKNEIYKFLKHARIFEETKINVRKMKSITNIKIEGEKIKPVFSIRKILKMKT